LISRLLVTELVKVVMKTFDHFRRRTLLKASIAYLFQAALVAPWVITTKKSLAQTMRPTPGCGPQTRPQMEGPFFTPLSPERTSLIESGMSAPRMVLAGQVVDLSCKPVAGALLDFWQCDDRGHYDNQEYRLRGHQYTNRQGEFRLTTLVPGEYPGRTPHIHVKVQRESGPVLTTQLYLPDHSRNARDFLFQPSLSMARRGSDLHFVFVVA